VSLRIDPARKCVIIHRPAASFQPCKKAGACVAHQLELNRSARLLLHDHRAGPDFRSYNQGADFDLDEIAAAQLAVDRQIEERSVPQTPLPIQKEADRPYLPGFQRAFRSDLLARIPCAAVGVGEVVLRMSHFVLLRP